MMKKSLLILGLISVAAACTMKEETSNPAKGGEVLYATIEDTGTKVYLDEDFRVLWNADDRISVFNFDTYNQQYSFDGKDGDNYGTFSIVADGKLKTSNDISKLYAVYPYSESNSISNSEVLSVNLPSEQTYADHSFGPGANTMAAVTSTDKMKFKNVCGYLMIKLFGDDVKVKSITIRGNNGEKIAGAASVSISEGEDPTTVMASDATTEITLACPEPVSIGTSSSDYTEFWFAIPPVEFTKGFTIVVEDGDGGSFTKTTGKSLAITRSYAQKMAPIEVVITNAVVINAEGGEYSLAGCSIEVPSGAVQEETEISIEKLEEAPEGSPEAEGLVAIYEFSPSGTTFQTPISVSFPVPDTADGTPMTLLYLNPEDNHWQACGESTVAGGTVTFQLSHFSTYALTSGTSPVIPDYLCFTSSQDGSTVSLNNDLINSGSNWPNVEYSTDGSNWTTWDFSAITLDNGNKLYLRGNNPNGFSLHPNNSSEEKPGNHFAMTGQLSASGNIMSLIYGADFEDKYVIPDSAIFCFYFLFGDYGVGNCHALVSVDGLKLPATTLSLGCYTGMFSGCSFTKAPELPAMILTTGCYATMFQDCFNLTDAPALPATTLADACYNCMFASCTSLTIPPALPSTSLTKGCYGAMFIGCTSLTAAPELPAEILTETCYHAMFSGCSSLSYIKMLATDITADRCLDYWVENVASTGTFVKNAAAGSDVDSVAPPGWEIKTNIPSYLCFTSREDGSTVAFTPTSDTAFHYEPDLEYSTDGTHWAQWDLSAITLNDGEYVYLRGDNPDGFNPFCSRTTIGNIDESNRFSMTGTVALSGNIMSLLDQDDFDNLDTVPGVCFSFLFCMTPIVSAPKLSATNLGKGCYEFMFGGCDKLTEVPVLPAMVLNDYCYYGMFTECQALTEMPRLPAITLAESCYQGMFAECTSLKTVYDLPATTLAESCYWAMFSGCTSLKNAPALPATKLVLCCYGIMFSGCSNLEHIEMMATDISAVDCLTHWLDNVASQGTFVMNSQATWGDPKLLGYVPSGWNVYDQGGTPLY